MVFDIFCSKIKFNFYFCERFWLYFWEQPYWKFELEPLLRCFKCPCARGVRRSMRLFAKAEAKYMCNNDIVNIMSAVKNSANFL